MVPREALVEAQRRAVAEGQRADAERLRADEAQRTSQHAIEEARRRADEAQRTAQQALAAERLRADEARLRAEQLQRRLDDLARMCAFFAFDCDSLRLLILYRPTLPGMTVFVNQQGKHPLRLKIGRSESVAALKMRIAYKTGLDPQHIRLIHGGRELTDNNQRQLSFNNETVVSLLVRLPGPQDETRYNQPTP
jgi:seryl-tRNA synthetase